jgi:hypothetical protein
MIRPGERLAVDRGTWFFYAAAAVIAANVVMFLILGAWFYAIFAAPIAGWFGAYPWLRRQYYRFGYDAGILDTVDEVAASWTAREVIVAARQVHDIVRGDGPVSDDDCSAAVDVLVAAVDRLDGQPTRESP